MNYNTNSKFVAKMSDKLPYIVNEPTISKVSRAATKYQRQLLASSSNILAMKKR